MEGFTDHTYYCVTGIHFHPIFDTFVQLINHKKKSNHNLLYLEKNNLATCKNNCPGVRENAVIVGGGSVLLASSLSGK